LKSVLDTNVLVATLLKKWKESLLGNRSASLEPFLVSERGKEFVPFPLGTATTIYGKEGEVIDG
jgi:hypothetical protein